MCKSAIAAFAAALACVCGGDVDPAAAIGVSASLNVAAVVDQRCSILVNSFTFGTYDYAGAHAVTPLDATGSVNVNCEAGRRVDVRLDQGQYPEAGSSDAAPLRQMFNGSATYLPYNLYEDAAHTTVWDNEPRSVLSPLTFPTIMTVYGRIQPGVPVQTGSYSDSVTATVYF
jgi:spore coat protein U-like protein